MARLRTIVVIQAIGTPRSGLILAGFPPDRHKSLLQHLFGQVAAPRNAQGDRKKARARQLIDPARTLDDHLEPLPEARDQDCRFRVTGCGSAMAPRPAAVPL